MKQNRGCVPISITWFAILRLLVLSVAALDWSLSESSTVWYTYDLEAGMSGAWEQATPKYEPLKMPLSGNVYLFVCHVPLLAQTAVRILHRAGKHKTDQQIHFSGWPRFLYTCLGLICEQEVQCTKRATWNFFRSSIFFRFYFGSYRNLWQNWNMTYFIFL